MPVVSVKTDKISPEKRKKLIAEITATVSDITALPPETVTVFVEEFDLDQIGVGGKSLQDLANA